MYANKLFLLNLSQFQFIFSFQKTLNCTIKNNEKQLQLRDYAPYLCVISTMQIVHFDSHFQFTLLFHNICFVLILKLVLNCNLKKEEKKEKRFS